MLLTSSQISMGLSSAIVFTFSTILFLSGYLLQQQTVHELQAILRPVETLIPHHKQDSSRDAFDWKTVAYVQVLSRHEDVCAAAVTFAELARRGSRADRVLLYPRAWEREGRGSEEERRARERNMRLLRKIVARYGVVMKAVEVERQTSVGDATDTTIPLQKLFSLTEWQTLAYLAPPGVVHNASALDEVFALDMTSPRLDFWTEDSTVQEGQNAERQLVATLIRPNPATAQHEEMLRKPGVDMMTIAKLLGSESRSDKHLFGDTGSLRHVLAEDQNGDKPLPAYMRFFDPSLPGPEYDIPLELWESSRPSNKQERLVWEKTYADYREQRMTICGLELEPVPKTVPEIKSSPEVHDEE